MAIKAPWLFAAAAALIAAPALLAAPKASPAPSPKAAAASDDASDQAADAAAAEEKDYWWEQSDAGIVFKQVLRWDAVPYALRYGVEIERSSETGAWSAVQSLETAETTAEVSLSAGDYRYRVTVFDVLGKPARASEWFDFKVRKAVQPRISGIEPERVWLEERNDGKFTVEGANLLPDTEYYFRSPERSGPGYRGAIVEIDPKARKAVLAFPVDRMDIGSYELVAENPGGLSARSDRVTVKYQKPVDIDVSAGYMPLFIPTDPTFKTYFDGTAVPLGTAVKVTFIPVKRSFGFFGAGLLLAAARAGASFETYELSTNWLTAHANFAYQKPLIKQRLNFDARIGVGATMLQDLRFVLDNGVESPDYSPWSISACAGAGLHIYPMKRLYVDVACDVSYAFMSDMFSLAVCPSLTAGWQF